MYVLRKKSLGQCFLEDQNILRIEAKLDECSDKRILEIGPGDGRLTEKILEQKPAKLYVVEKDSRFAELVRKRFGVDVDVIEADFLEAKLPEVDIIIGNIPYYISSEIVFRLKDLNIEKAVLMVQKEFAQKMIAKPGAKNYGRLSVTAQLFFKVSLKRLVSKHLFRPSPRVDSAIITLVLTKFKSSEFLENIIRYIFQHKNKTIRNALLDSKMFEKGELEHLGDLLKRRGKTLSKEECLEIAKSLEKYKKAGVVK